MNSTGPYYYNARWYDPNLGRFTTEDPIRSGTNWYIYANNNPLRFVDPTGLMGAAAALAAAESDTRIEDSDSPSGWTLPEEEKDDTNNDVSNVVKSQLKELGVDLTQMTEEQKNAVSQVTNVDDIAKFIALLIETGGLKNLTKISATIDVANALLKGSPEIIVASILYSATMGDYKDGFEFTGELANNLIKNYISAGAGVLSTKLTSEFFGFAAAGVGVGTVVGVGYGLNYLDSVMGSPVKNAVSDSLREADRKLENGFYRLNYEAEKFFMDYYMKGMGW